MKRAFKFAAAVLHHWGILFTGGVGIGVVTFWQYTGHTLPPKVGWIIGGVAVLGASFKAWNEQYERVEALLPQQSQEPPDAIELPAPPPELEALEAKLREEELRPKLTIEVVDVRTTTITYGNHATLVEFHQGFPAVLISFKNKPNSTPGQQTESFYDVTANLTYTGSDRTEHIDYGNWLKEYTRKVDFRPGETRELVIAMQHRETGAVVGLSNPKTHDPLKGRIRSGMIEVYPPDERLLPNPPCAVTVTLVSDNMTLLNERYQLSWTQGGTLEIKTLEDEHK